MSLYKTLNNALEPILGDRTQMILEEGVRRLGVSPEQLDVSQAEVILKRLVYRELQSKMSPNAARGRIEEMLSELGATAKPSKVEENRVQAQTENVLNELEAGFKRFSLYLDWPEVGRLRGLIGAIKQDTEANAVRGLVREGQEVLGRLEEKLQAALLRQTKDISDLQAALQKVQSVGGPKVRRLDNLIKTIEEAHTSETLALAEVERARALAAEMRKLVESSVVQNPASEMAITVEDDLLSESDPTVEVVGDESELVVDLDFDALTSEQQSRIREIDVAEDQRRLEVALERYGAILRVPHIAQDLQDLQAELAAGNPLGERLGGFELQLKQAYEEALNNSKTQFQTLLERSQQIQLSSEKTAPLQARLSVVQETLESGGLPLELIELQQTVETLEAEAQSLKAAKERQAQLDQALSILRAEAQASLAPFYGEDQVEIFLATLEDLPASEEAIGRARHGLSELLAHLAQEREEESLKRSGFKATLQAIPVLDVLEGERQSLLSSVETASVEDLERRLAAFVGQAKSLVSARLDQLEKRVTELEQGLADTLTDQRSTIESIRQALTQGRIINPEGLEQALNDLVVTRRAAVNEELVRYESVARSMKGLGGEDLEAKVQAARAQLVAGQFPDLAEIHAQLNRLRRAQEALRAELAGRISALLEAYNEHKGVGGETVYRLKPMCDFLQSASDRLARLGASGLLEVRRALEEAERLEAQLAGEFQAARSVMSELKGADLESLLDVFDATVEPPPTPSQAPTPPPAAPSVAVVEGSNLSAELKEALASFQIRGVEAVALIEAGQVLWGGLPIQSQIPQSVFDDLRNLASELASGAPQLSVISLASSVVVMLPLGQKGLVVLGEKALLSRILTQIEKHREVLERA